MPAINLYIYSQLIFDKGVKIIHRGRPVLSTNGAGVIGGELSGSPPVASGSGRLAMA